MSRALRWVLGLGLAAMLLIGGLLLLPFHDWLPGGTVATGTSRFPPETRRPHRLQ